jgi:hypothetical protein
VPLLHLYIDITTKKQYYDKNVTKTNINSEMIGGGSKQLTTDQWYCIKEKSGIYLAWDGREYIQGGCNYCDKYLDSTAILTPLTLIISQMIAFCSI